MQISEHESERKTAQIVEQMEYLIMDVILMCIKKINTENQLLSEIQEITLEDRLETQRHQKDFQSFGETESGYPGEET